MNNKVNKAFFFSSVSVLILIISLIFSVIFVPTVSASESIANEGLTLEISSTETAAVGETFTMQVNASRVDNVGAITIMFKYDTQKLKIVEKTNADGNIEIGTIKPVLNFGSMNMKTLSYDKGSPGKFRLDATGITPWNSEGVIITVDFEVLDDSPTSIEIIRDECIVANYDAKNIDFVYINGKVNYKAKEVADTAEEMNKYISGLPQDINGGDKSLVDSLGNMYDNLPDDEKSKVENASALDAARNKVSALEPIESSSQSSIVGNENPTKKTGTYVAVALLVLVAVGLVVVTIITVRRKKK